MTIHDDLREVMGRSPSIRDAIALGAERRSYKRINPMDMVVPVTESGCWLWVGTNNGKGYGLVYNPVLKKMDAAHRYFYAMANGPIPAGVHICHKCDTPSCVNPEHLYAGDYGSNLADKVRRNRIKGERHSNAKLTNELVLRIKRMAKAMGHLAIAKELGLHRCTVAHVVKGTRWGHILLQEESSDDAARSGGGG